MKCARGRRIVEILNHDGQIVDGQRDRRTHQHELHHRQEQGEAQRQRRERSGSVLCGSVPKFVSWFLRLHGDLAFLAGFFHHADENVFERESAFARAETADPAASASAGVADARCHIAVGDDVQAIAE